jgi:iron-sulfur cluster assembly protein
MIEVSDKAIQEIKRIQSAEGDAASSYLRVMVVGGGCSGMSYKIGFDHVAPPATDKIFEKGGIKLVVDPKSYLFLSGTTLDYSDGFEGRGFVFNNPNAKRTCGCGSSFSA